MDWKNDPADCVVAEPKTQLGGRRGFGGMTARGIFSPRPLSCTGSNDTRPFALLSKRGNVKVVARSMPPFCQGWQCQFQVRTVTEPNSGRMQRYQGNNPGRPPIHSKPPSRPVRVGARQPRLRGSGLSCHCSVGRPMPARVNEHHACSSDPEVVAGVVWKSCRRHGWTKDVGVAQLTCQFGPEDDLSSEQDPWL